MFESYIINAITDRYGLMCFIDAYDKQHPSYVDDVSSGGGNVLTPNATTEALVSLGETIDFINFWLKYFDHTFLACSNMYIETMQYLFQKVPVQLSKPLILKENSNHYYILLEVIGTEKMNQKLPPPQKNMIKKSQ